MHTHSEVERAPAQKWWTQGRKSRRTEAAAAAAETSAVMRSQRQRIQRALGAAVDADPPAAERGAPAGPQAAEAGFPPSTPGAGGGGGPAARAAPRGRGGILALRQPADAGGVLGGRGRGRGRGAEPGRAGRGRAARVARVPQGGQGRHGAPRGRPRPLPLVRARGRRSARRPLRRKQGAERQRPPTSGRPTGDPAPPQVHQMWLEALAGARWSRTRANHVPACFSGRPVAC